MAGSKTRKEDGIRSVANGHAIFGRGEPPYTSAVGEFAGGGSIRVLWMRDLADAN